MSASADEKGLVEVTTLRALPMQAAAATIQITQTMKLPMGLRRALVGGDGRVVQAGVLDRDALDRLCEEHVLRVDQVVAGVLGQLELVPERDRVEGAGELAVAAEDAARQVDLVDPGV